MSDRDDAARCLARLRERLPALPPPPSTLEEADRRILRTLIHEAGDDLERLRARPRRETAPLVRFREACRLLLVSSRGLERAARRLAAARRRLETLAAKTQRGD